MGRRSATRKMGKTHWELREEKCPVRRLFDCDKHDDDITVNDCVQIRYNLETHQREAEFASITKCRGCTGAREVYVHYVKRDPVTKVMLTDEKGDHIFVQKTIKRPELALQVQLLEFGYSSLKNWDNLAPARVCDCDTRLEELSAHLTFDLPIVLEQTAWHPHVAGPCITDYTKRVTFERELTQGQLELFCEFLQKSDCPGWTGVHAGIPISRDDGAIVYQFTTTLDTSG